MNITPEIIFSYLTVAGLFICFVAWLRERKITEPYKLSGFRCGSSKSRELRVTLAIRNISLSVGLICGEILLIIKASKY